MVGNESLVFSDLNYQFDYYYTQEQEQQIINTTTLDWVVAQRRATCWTKAIVNNDEGLLYTINRIREDRTTLSLSLSLSLFLNDNNRKDRARAGEVYVNEATHKRWRIKSSSSLSFFLMKEKGAVAAGSCSSVHTENLVIRHDRQQRPPCHPRHGTQPEINRKW